MAKKENDTTDQSPSSGVEMLMEQGAVPIPAEGQFFRSELRQAMSLVYDVCLRAINAKEKLSSLNEDDDAESDQIVWSPDRIHQNIGILGRRGAGKTSFLLTLLKLLDSGTKQNKFRDKYSENGIILPLSPSGIGEVASTLGTNIEIDTWHALAKTIVIGGLIEPSHMESGDHVVAMAYASLLKRAQTLIRHSPPRDEGHQKKVDRFLSASQKVTEHLPILFSKNRLNQVFRDDGSEGLHDEIMKSRSGHRLEQALWGFIRCFLEIHNKPLVVLALDDVDLAYERGEEVLESLRRYLTSPQMLILVTGDQGLFERVLEKRYFIDRDSAEMTDEIITQYLKKIMPAWLRIHLPDSVVARNLEEITISRQFARDTSELPVVEEQYKRLLCSCLRLPRSILEDSEEMARLLEQYRFILPPDFRRFSEICSLDFSTCEKSGPMGEDDAGRVTDLRFLELAKVWEDRLAKLWEGGVEENTLSTSILRNLSYDRRIGIRILNLLIRARRLDGVSLRLDPRSDEKNLNLVMAFLRFSIEANLDRYHPLGLLGLGLDFCVPSYYLGRLKLADQQQAFRELDLRLIDSPRRLFKRLVPWLSRRNENSTSQPGVVPLSNRAGALEAFLDLLDTTQTAAWRWILGDTDRVSLPRWLHEAAMRSGRFLRNGFSWSPQQLYGSEVEPSDNAWREMSGYRWATRYLPDLLFPAYHHGLFVGRELRVRGIESTDPRKARTPLISECVTTPRLFDQLAGALPRVILRCWTIDDGRRSYLNPWQGLSLVHRIFDRLVEVIQDPNFNIPFRADGHKRETEPAHDTEAVDRLIKIILGCLRDHFASDIGSSSEGLLSRVAPRGGILAESSSVVDHPREWSRLLEELRTVENPQALYPKLENGNLDFRLRIEPGAGLAGRDKATVMKDVWEGKAFGAWFSNLSPVRHGEYEGERIKDWHTLQGFRLDAWDCTLQRLALAITEWALYWLRVLKSPGSQRANLELIQRLNFEQIQSVFDTFFNDLGDEEEFADEWSGGGDIIQRWILTFLNSVLVRTLCPPENEVARKKSERPTLIVGRRERVPGRTAPEELGCAHSLYENLTRLHQKVKGDSEMLSRSEHWHPSETFLALASFPILAIFLPSGGPLPRVVEPQSKNGRSGMSDPGDDAIGNLQEEIFDFQCIVRFGKLMLIPLPEVEYFPDGMGDKKRVLLDLGCLSWCGLPLRAGTSEEGGGVPTSPIRSIEERRKALIAMLNSVVAEMGEPHDEAKKFLAPLVLAVHEALIEQQNRRSEKLRRGVGEAEKIAEAVSDQYEASEQVDSYERDD
ncbi:MAG: hypothetical protein GY835_05230 [bacterium]|nr:hypothetical protein [bacterium]